MAGAPVPDTIAAIATPPGRGGVGIVRVSGGAASVDRLARALVGVVPPARSATLATFRDAAGQVVDSGLLVHFPAPHSYTGETVLELHGHGSPAALALLLGRCVELGARLAQPGEFTRRAFLNGKLDLAQAEAVADLIGAASATAARAAARSLTGDFSHAVHAIVAEVTHVRTVLEATLDFPEEDVELVRTGELEARLQGARGALATLTSRARAGARLREGLAVVLVGRPNVGKSSLLNRLVREDAAIVTDVPGTTRDPVERGMDLHGVPLTLVDTAGLHDTADTVERIGIARTEAALTRADVAVVIVDARDDDGMAAASSAAGAGALPGEDAAVLARLPAGLPQVIVHNKTDLAGAPTRVLRVAQATAAGAGAAVRGTGTASTVATDIVAHVWLSALHGEGIDLLEGVLLEVAGMAATPDDALMARARHLEALRDADVRLAEAARQLAARAPALELVAEELRQAQASLAGITGEFTADDLLGAIFSRFCIGK